MSFPEPGLGPLLILPGAGNSWLADAEAAGWLLRGDGVLPEDPWDLSDTLVRPPDRSLAALALARSAAVAIDGFDDDDVLALLDDARRIDCRLWPAPVGPQIRRLRRPVVDDDTEVLLRHLADGASVSEAARVAHMSLRTAQRRLGELRSRFGVRTTAGAVAAWARENGRS